MIQIIALFNQSGGVGKTTLTMNLGYHLAQCHPNRVLLLDMDKVTQNVLGNEEGQLVRAMFDSLGLMTWESFASSRLPLRNLLEEILEALRTGRIEYTKATAIARLPDSFQRQSLLEDAIQENLSLTQIRERIKAARPVNEKPQALKNKIKEASSRLQKAKFWDNPKKQKQLEKLLA